MPSAVSPFQVPCSSMAASSPSGTAQRACRWVAAYATPSPVIEVKIGWASGDSTPRSTNVTSSSLTPPTSGRTSAPM